MANKRIVVIATLSVLVAGAGLAYVFGDDIEWDTQYKAGIAARDRCNFESAAEMFKEAVKASDGFAIDDQRRFPTKLALAQLSVALGHHRDAKKYIDELIKEANVSNNKKNLLTAMSLRAALLYRQARFSECKNLNQKIANLAEEDHMTLVAIDAYFAMLQQEVLYAKREEVQWQIQQVERLQNELDYLGTTEVVLGIYSAQSSELAARYKTASLMYDGVLKVVRQTENKESALSLSLLNAICTFYLQDRNVPRAKTFSVPVLKDADKSFESYFSGSSLHALRNASEIALTENQLGAAEKNIEKEIKEVGARISTEHPFFGVAIEHRGTLKVLQSKYDDSEADFTAANNIFEKAMGPNNRFSAHCLVELSKSHLAQNELDAGAITCKRAIEMYKLMLPYDHPDVYKAQTVLAQIYRKQNKNELAEDIERESIMGLSAADSK